MIHSIILIHFEWTCMLLTAISHSKHLTMVDELAPFHFLATYLKIAEYWKQRAFSIQPKIPEILVGTSKFDRTDRFSLVQLEYSGPALKVVLFDWSGHFGQLDWNVPFLFDKIVDPKRGTALLYPAYKNNNQTCRKIKWSICMRTD